MAKKFLSNIDLGKNELQNAVVHVLAAAPSSPVDGQFYYNSVDDLFYGRANGAWVELGGGGAGISNGYGTITDGTNNAVAVGADTFKIRSANSRLTVLVANNEATHNDNVLLTLNEANIVITASQVSDFNTAVRTNRLDQMAAPTGSVSMNNQKIVSLLDPTAAQDGATKAYVDAMSQGLTDFKESARVATAAVLPTNTRTGNILTASANASLNTAGIDGVTTLAVNDRVLVRSEATGANNGLYFVSDLGSAGTPWTLTRTLDADSSAEVTSGMYLWIEEGTNFADTAYVLSTNNPITLNTTSLTFTLFARAGELTGANVGTGAGTLFRDKTSGNLNFKTLLNGSSTKLTITNNANDVTLTVLSTLKFEALIGDGAESSIVVTHNLGTRAVVVSVHEEATPWNEVYCDVQKTSTNTITLIFASAPNIDEYRVTVIG